jgi:hypothetical protein
MTDNILDRIDAAVGCFNCHGHLADDSPSGDFCSAECQAEWHASHAVPIERYREPWDRPWDFPGVGTDAFRNATRTPRRLASNHLAPLAIDIVLEPAEFRLPRMTGNLLTDVLALDRAIRAATTPAQRAACSLRSAQLREGQLEAHQQMIRALRPAFEAASRSFAELGRQTAAALSAMAASVAQLPVPADNVDRAGRGDVMERALVAARSRNTGPDQRRRAPRRIDATGSR